MLAKLNGCGNIRNGDPDLNGIHGKSMDDNYFQNFGVLLLRMDDGNLIIHQLVKRILLC
jgi:hypothetical protein